MRFCWVTVVRFSSGSSCSHSRVIGCEISLSRASGTVIGVTTSSTIDLRGEPVFCSHAVKDDVARADHTPSPHESSNQTQRYKSPCPMSTLLLCLSDISWVAGLPGNFPRKKASLWIKKSQKRSNFGNWIIYAIKSKEEIDNEQF